MTDDDENPFLAWERNFREAMKRARESQGWTQTDLARQLKAFGLPFHQQTIDRIESGKRPVRLNEAHLIARELGVDLEAMTADGGPSDRELHVAANRLVREAEQVAEGLNEIMGQWHEAIGYFAYLVFERIRDENVPMPDRTPATRWGARVLLEAGALYDDLLNVWTAFVRASGDEDPVLRDDGLKGDLDAWAAQVGHDRTERRSLSDLTDESPVDPKVPEWAKGARHGEHPEA